MRNFKLITILLIILAGMPCISRAQVKLLTGTVVDGKGKPIAGASVLIEGKAAGTVTDDLGKFKLNALVNSNLIITSTGFRSQIVKWNGTDDIKIDMVEDIARLDEVVVTGLSTSIKRRNLANSVVTISATQLNGVELWQKQLGIVDDFRGFALAHDLDAARGPVAVVQLRGGQSPHGGTGAGIGENVARADHERGLVPPAAVGALVATASAMGPNPWASACC